MDAKGKWFHRWSMELEICKISPSLLTLKEIKLYQRMIDKRIEELERDG